MVAMAEGIVSRKLLMRLVYVVLCLALLFLQLLPLETTPRRWAGPDFLVVLSLAWAVRQPDYTPPLLVALIFLLADFLLLRPPGLQAAIMVLACQVQRRRALSLRDATFATEWITAAAVMLLAMVGYRAMLMVFLVEQASFGLMLMQVLMNVAIYPIVVLASHLFCGVRRSTARESGLRAV